MRHIKSIWKPLLAGLFFFFAATPCIQAQGLTVENVRTDNFPELRFDVRSEENLVANKARLIVKDNYVPVKTFRIAAGKTSSSYVISYTVPDPERLDGTTTFEYKGKSITTTYLVKKPTPEQEEAYPKVERSDNTLFYIIGGLGILAGLAGFILSRRSRRKNAVSVYAQEPPPTPPVIQPAPPVPPRPTPASEEAYKPKPQATTEAPAVPETMVSPGLMPTLSIRINERVSVLTPNGTLQKIGRAPECDLIIPHPTVSKIHASIQLQNGTWWIEDLGSTNGTYADGQRITRAPLHDGSKLYFGQVTGAFTLPK